MRLAPSFTHTALHPTSLHRLLKDVDQLAPFQLYPYSKIVVIDEDKGYTKVGMYPLPFPAKQLS